MERSISRSRTNHFFGLIICLKFLYQVLWNEVNLRSLSWEASNVNLLFFKFWLFFTSCPILLDAMKIFFNLLSDVDIIERCITSSYYFQDYQSGIFKLLFKVTYIALGLKVNSYILFVIQTCFYFPLRLILFISMMMSFIPLDSYYDIQFFIFCFSK